MFYHGFYKETELKLATVANQWQPFTLQKELLQMIYSAFSLNL